MERSLFAVGKPEKLVSAEDHRKVGYTQVIKYIPTDSVAGLPEIIKEKTGRMKVNYNFGRYFRGALSIVRPVFATG